MTTTLTYDHAHRVLRVATGAGTICRYAYDGDGNRTKRLDQNGVIHYVGDLYERNLGYGGNQQNRETRYYYAQLGSEHRLLGFRTRSSGTDAPLTIVGTDHLGGPIATASGTTGTPITGRLRYTPFGEARDATGDFGTDRGFTGQTRDAVAGTYWYKSRFYDSVVGRFCQPDTVVPGAANPQALNRYSYAFDNPLRHVDRSGHDPLDAQWRSEFKQAHGRTPDWRDESIRLYSIAFPAEWKAGGEGKQFYGSDGRLPGPSVINSVYQAPPAGRDWSHMPGALQSMAGWYRPGEEEQYARDIGFLFAGLASRSEAGALGALWGAQVHPNVYLGTAGLNPLWTGTTDPDANVHHWAAHFTLGYEVRYGGLGRAANELREFYQGLTRGSYDDSDLRIGNAAAQMGADMRAGRFGLGDVGPALTVYVPVIPPTAWP